MGGIEQDLIVLGGIEKDLIVLLMGGIEQDLKGSDQIGVDGTDSAL